MKPVGGERHDRAARALRPRPAARLPAKGEQHAVAARDEDVGAHGRAEGKQLCEKRRDEKRSEPIVLRTGFFADANLGSGGRVGGQAGRQAPGMFFETCAGCQAVGGSCLVASFRGPVRFLP